uniref:Uncharacterized protein n=1 Tax=Oryza punctata TaxID=4537 RepID=A0A0E0LSA1_ORYPU
MHPLILNSILISFAPPTGQQTRVMMAETNNHVTMQAQVVALTEFIQTDTISNSFLLPFSNTAESPRHVIVTISPDAGQNTTVDTTVSHESTGDESDSTKNIEDTKTKLLERGVVTAASAAAAMVSHFLRGAFNHHQEGYYIILILFLLMGLVQMLTAKWTSQTRLGQVVVLLALVPQVLVAGVIISTFTN